MRATRRWILPVLLATALVGIAAAATSSLAPREWRRARHALLREAADTALAPLRLARPGLRSEARVAPAEAWAIARAAVDSGEPASGTLQELGGRLVYVLVFERRGRPLTEVIVDAVTGGVVGTGSIRARTARRVRGGHRGP